MATLEEQLRQTRLSESQFGDDDAILSLWYVRNFLNRDDLDAYEYVSQPPVPIAGLSFHAGAVEPGSIEEERDSTLTAVSICRNTTEEEVAELARSVVDSLAHESTANPARVLAEGLRLRVPARVDPTRLAVVVSIVLPEISLTDRIEIDRAGIRVVFRDRVELERVADAVSNPGAFQGTIDILAEPAEILETEIGEGRVFACPVSASAIARWEGISNRMAFDLNVRLKLGTGRVRRSLDQAVVDEKQASNFLASHNGLTVVCDEVLRDPSGLKVKNYSVVNGAQSAIAFFENKDRLSPDLRVLVKFAEVGTTNPLSREIAIRSNTQNPVNSRNFKALDPRQLSLKRAIETDFDAYVYEVRPNARSPKSDPIDKKIIKNDDAAQQICTLYNQKPWLAVKRLALFESPEYDEIFNSTLTAAQVVFSNYVFTSVYKAKATFPETYQKAWKLTALVGTYIVGQLLRSNDHLRSILHDPSGFLLRRDDLDLDRLIEAAAGAMARREEAKAGRPDEFKVEFKSRGTVQVLADEARNVLKQLGGAEA